MPGFRSAEYKREYQPRRAKAIVINLELWPATKMIGTYVVSEYPTAASIACPFFPGQVKSQHIHAK